MRQLTASEASNDEMERRKFLAWLEDEQGLYGEEVQWQTERNCFARFGVHLAWCAWQAALKNKRE